MATLNTNPFDRIGTILGGGLTGGGAPTSPKWTAKPADTSRPRGGMVKLVPNNGASPLTLILTGPPDRGGGVGGWQSTDRALRRPARWWGGQPEDTMSLACLLDLDAIGGPAIERRLEVLYAMGAPTVDGDAPPPVLVLGDVPDKGSKPWVIQNITLADRLYGNGGALRRIAVTVELEGYAELPAIKPVAIKRTRDQGGKRRVRTITTKKNDTLRAIAVRQLGQSDAWKSIRDWNPKTLKGVEPDAPLRAGITVKLR